MMNNLTALTGFAKKAAVFGFSAVLFHAAIAAPVEGTVKFDPTASANFSVTSIAEFDWQSTGDLVTKEALPGGGTFSSWAASAGVGDTAVIDQHAHARLSQMLDGLGNVAPPTLSKNGSSCSAGANCFEVTAALDITAIVSVASVAPLTLNYDSVSGFYAFYLSEPNSDVQTGAGFNDGMAFLTGTLSTVVGDLVDPQSAVAGGVTLRNTVGVINGDVIQPEAADILVASTYDQLISLPSTLDFVVGTGGAVGLSGIRGAQDLVFKSDANTEFFVDTVEEEGDVCRMTGGGVDSTGAIVGGSLGRAEEGRDRYTFGGQIGAPTASQPQPRGEWTHHLQKSSKGNFIFHAGTASAPAGTKITNVTCSDPGFCNPARPAPFKQLDFEGIGSFKNVKGAFKKEVTVGQLYWFEAHIEDIGEPGPGGKQPHSNMCTHTPRSLVDESLDCSNCADVYQIRIWAYPTNPADDASNFPIYDAWWGNEGGFIDGGNLQIHPAIQ